MNGIRAGPAGGVEDLLDDEIALGGGRAPQGVCLVRVAGMQRRAVRVGVDRDRRDRELAQRPEDAHRDLAAVCHQDFREGGHEGPYSV